MSWEKRDGYGALDGTRSLDDAYEMSLGVEGVTDSGA